MAIELHQCHTEKDQKLYNEGKLGVACSVDILMSNIEHMVDPINNHFLLTGAKGVLETPSLGGRHFNMAYFPDSGKETLEVTVKGSGEVEQKLQRAKRNLSYKILRRKASHGVNYQFRIDNDSVTLSAIPMILSFGM